MRASVKYGVISKFSAEYPVSVLCKFFEVSRSGYYSWLKRGEQLDKDELLGHLIRDCQDQMKRTYGYRRVKLWLLRRTGLVINHKAVLRLMRKYNLLSEIRRARPLYFHQQKIIKYENVIAGDFTATQPNLKWATDVSCIFTKEGIVYLSMIKDLYDNFIVSYEMGTKNDYSLVFRTIQKAEKMVADGLILHSDRGFQYTSRPYCNLMKEYGILPSMSRGATPLDNACAENFFGILKTECIYRHSIQTIAEAEKLIDDYIYFYNYERIQLKTKLTPYEKRSQFA